MSGLEPERALLQHWLDVVAGHGFDAIDALPNTPASGPLGAGGLAIADAVSLPIPEAPHAGGITELVGVIERAATASLTTSGPGYLAYVPGGGLPSAALADFLACLINRYTGLTAAAPALCRLESDVIDWLAREFGLPPSTRGLLTTGGSLANLAAIVTARHARFGDSGELAHATVYTSAQAHLSVTKAVRIAGIPQRNVRSVATDTRLRLDTSALAAAIADDRAAGRTPLMVVSSAGTTNTGAVDPLAAIAELCAREQLWHHVDAAYGGAFVLCDEGKRRLAGIALADSITFDPHKGMFLPYGTGCLLVRDGEQLRDAHHLDAAYLQDLDIDRDAAPPSPTEYGPELSRDYRGLRLWLPLQLHGAAAFRLALAEKLALAERFHAMLRDVALGGRPIEIIDAPQLSIVAWRLTRAPGEALAAWNARNQAWLRRINARDRVHLSSTLLPVEDGAAYTLRACVLSFRTHQAHVDACLDDLVATL